MQAQALEMKDSLRGIPTGLKMGNGACPRGQLEKGPKRDEWKDAEVMVEQSSS